MNIYTQYRLFKWPKFRAGEFSAGLSEAGRMLGYSADNVRVSISGRLGDGTDFYRVLKFGEDIDAICDLKPLQITVYFEPADSLPKIEAKLRKGHYEDEFKIIVAAEKAVWCQKTLDALESTLSLTVVHDSQAKNELNNRPIKSKTTQQSILNNYVADTQNDLSVPEKVTLKWLYSHVPIKFWWLLIVLTFTAFMAGVLAARLSIIQELVSLIFKLK